MLRISRGLASDDVSVLVNRAVVVETSQPFVEVSVAQPEIADVSPLSDRALYVLGRARGKTTLTLLGENGTLIANVTIAVQPDLAELKERLRAVLPNEPIEVRSASTGLVLSGVVSGKAKLDRAMALARAYTGAEVTNMMSVGGTQQVALKVRIAEMSRNAGKALGINLGVLGSTGGTATQIQTGNTTASDVGTGGLQGGEGFETVATGFGFFGTLFEIGENFLLDVSIDALEDKGYARRLAEPTLVALSGTEARFLAGGEVPIQVVEDDDVSIEFKPIGVSLNFLPTVLDDDVVNIAVSAEVTSIDTETEFQTAGLTSNAFVTRRATTTVELRDGQSFAIAGLYDENSVDNISQVPWLGDIPVLGALFRSSNFQRGETELVIIVTANLVVPMDSMDQLQIPQDRVALPSEFDFFLNGVTSDEFAGPAGGISSQSLDGAFGYVVE